MASDATPPRSESPESGRLARLAGLSFITGFSGAMMPGPLLVVTIQQTIARGWDAFFWLITGHAVLEMALVLLLILGLRAVLARPRVRAAIGIVGGAALLYMGIDMMRTALGLSLATEAETTAAYGVFRLMFLGAAVCIANPYFTGWWATIGVGQMAHMAPRATAEYLAFYLGHEGADYVWYGLVALIISTGRQWMPDPLYQGLILVCGAIIILLSLWFALTGVRILFRPDRGAIPESAASVR
ncbi:MAG: LysE family transporter [Candidatus Sumerlaeota bacterium]